jgi:nicotinate-nucleotide adenylyltransferase
MTRIGIFGGSFNPVHMGHVLLARQLRQLAALDEVWLMVSPQNPLKQSAELLDDRLRYQLTRIALHGEQGIRACSYELHLPKPSYTWNTLQHLKEDFPECDFTLLIGGDNWALFPKWYRAGDILASHRVVVYPRRGVTIEADSLPSGVSVVEARLLDVSSTDVRSRVAGGHSIRGLVPATIESLVQSLYRGIAAGEER